MVNGDVEATAGRRVEHPVQTVLLHVFPLVLHAWLVEPTQVMGPFATSLEARHPSACRQGPHA
jgi:hypothetical protein